MKDEGCELDGGTIGTGTCDIDSIRVDAECILHIQYELCVEGLPINRVTCDL